MNQYFYSPESHVIIEVAPGNRMTFMQPLFITEPGEKGFSSKKDEGGSSKKVRKPRKTKVEGNEKWKALDDEPTGRRSPLLPDTIIKIKEMLVAGEKVAKIAEETGVSQPTIYKFKNDLNL